MSSSTKFLDTFPSFKYRNYRLWFGSQIISLLGTWMQTTAQGFFVYELTKSPAFLGYVGFAAGIPTWLLMIYAGVFADRYSRRYIIMTTQTILMILAFILAALAFTNTVQPWHIIVLAFFAGIANSVEAPSRQAFVNELVPKEDLINAIALNSTMFQSGAALGPAIAGIVYAVFGPAWCFTINAISFLPVIYNLSRMHFEKKETQRTAVKRSTVKELAGGFRYLRGQRLIMLVMVIIAMTSMFGLGMMTLIPDWAVDILHGDASTNGILQASRGLGAVVCSLIIASQSRKIKKGLFVFSGLLTLSLFMILFSFNSTYIISCLLLFGVGVGMIAINNLSNSLTQSTVAEEFRGRIMAVYSFSFFALMPVGALWAGMLAEHLGSPAAVLINGTILFSFAVFVWFKFPRLRSIG